MHFPHLPHAYFYYFSCSDSLKMWREVLRPCLTFSVPGNHCPPTQFASAQAILSERAAAIACWAPASVCTQDPAPESKIETSGLSVLLLIHMFMLTYGIYLVAQFSESSKNCKLGGMFLLYADLPKAITIAGTLGHVWEKNGTTHSHKCQRRKVV